MRLRYATCIGWIAFCCYAFSDAGQSVLSIIPAMLFAGVWMALWLERLLRTGCLSSARTPENTRINCSLLSWGIEPLVLILIGWLAVSGTLSDTRFALSMNSMNAYVDEVQRGEVDLDFEWHHPSRYIGLYSTTRTERLEDGTVRFVTSSSGLLDRAGFAYSPNGRPMRRGEDSYTHLYGKWWRWRESW